ncbi:ATP-binding cassette transporter snq2, partial [Coemansia sp. RSA 1694]
YNQEDDMHFPTLTVRKTLEFAIQCKTPSRQVLRDPAAYRRDVLSMLLDMYGLAGCADTIVGNAFLRGVSGGERKRVSIAEQVASGAAVEVWDGSTKGLDASSALDYVRSLRINADILQKTVVATIYQASESIYQLFDKVMVIDEGRQLYFGPIGEAVGYFESIGIHKPPRQTTSDFLTGLTRLNERQVVPGWEERAPKTAEEFEQLWRQSSAFDRVTADVAAFESQITQDGRGDELREFVNRTKMGTEHEQMRRKSPYTTTFFFQLSRLMTREWEIFLGNPQQIVFRIIYNIAFAIIVGTLFIRLPANTSSFFTRGGVLFFALLFNSLTSLSEIPKAVTGRQVVYKHKALAMYHPAALSLAQTAIDMPFSLFQVVVFGSILYWATGLQRTGGHFLAFLLFLYIGCLCLTAFFRLIGNASPNVDVGHTASGVSLLFMILYVGYLIPPPTMHHYFKWIYWANPLAYGFKALLSNEYRNMVYPCAASSLAPRGDGIGIANQVCTIAGSTPGQLMVSGREYLERGFSIHTRDQWKDFVAVSSFWILFVFLVATVMEFVEYGNAGYTINVYKRRPPHIDAPSDEEKALDTAGGGGAGLYRAMPAGGPSDEQIAAGTTYTAGAIDWPQAWAQSPECRDAAAEIARINQIKADAGSSAGSAEDHSRKYARRLPYQLQIVTRRMFRSHWRDLQYNLTRIALQAVCALAVGFSFIKVGDGTVDTQNKTFAIFETAVLSILVINQVQPQFLRQRIYYSREASTNQYGWEAFSFAVIVTEWPFAVVSNTLFFVCFYWLVGLNSLANRTGYFYIAYILLGIFSLSLGQAIAAFSPNDIVASMLNPIFTSMMMLFSGVTITYSQMPHFWHSWMYWLSPYHYFIEGVIVNEMHDTPIRCKSTGQSCSQFAGSWVDSTRGYLRDPGATGSCDYCMYLTGDEYFNTLNWSFAHRWRNFCILLGFTAFNVLFTVFMTRMYK